MEEMILDALEITDEDDLECFKEEYGIGEYADDPLWMDENCCETDGDVSDTSEPACVPASVPVQNTPAETVPVEEFDDLPF